VDFLGRGVKPLMVISVEFMIKNHLSLFNLFGVFSDTGADERFMISI